jgi:hypothetical protein
MIALLPGVSTGRVKLPFPETPGPLSGDSILSPLPDFGDVGRHLFRC